MTICVDRSCSYYIKTYTFYYISQLKLDTNNNLIKNINQNAT